MADSLRMNIPDCVFPVSYVIPRKFGKSKYLHMYDVTRRLSILKEKKNSTFFLIQFTRSKNYETKLKVSVMNVTKVL